MIKPDIDEIAGARYMRQAIVKLVHADEAEIFPVCFGQLAVRRRQGDLQEITAPRGVVGEPLAGRKSPRLDEAHELARGVEPTDFIEHVIAEMPEFKFDSPALEPIQVLEQI